MKIIVDDKIPYIREVLDRITKDVIYIKGADITHAATNSCSTTPT